MFEWIEINEWTPYLFVASLFLKGTVLGGLFYFLKTTWKNQPIRRPKTDCIKKMPVLQPQIFHYEINRIVYWLAKCTRLKESADDLPPHHLLEKRNDHNFQGGLKWYSKIKLHSLLIKVCSY
ncbi:hypothetical protein [Peribacillus tepidiphilus]|uniref:hypothetical protein n=1 Tax=Peribacillus tepidiphilus TaxID=2652445 RepID=UPI0035B50D1B